MKQHTTMPSHLGRKSRLVQALALAITFSASGIAVAGSSHGNTPATQGMPITAAQAQANAAIAARQARRRSAQAAEQARAMAPQQTWHTTNCDDSGNGSLRWAIGQAASGDTIDLTTMACSVIEITNVLAISQNDLTIVGKTSTPGVPGSRIKGTARVIHHGGTGMLTLTKLSIHHGRVSSSTRGGCIRSAGSVTLNTSQVVDCRLEPNNTTSGPAEGGGIHAAGDVILKAFSEVRGNQAVGNGTDAYGGGIWAGGWVQITGASTVRDNTVETQSGKAYGGGIYGQGWVDVVDGSNLSGNLAKASVPGALISGIGAYTATDIILEGALIIGNHADTYNYQLGQGGFGAGIYAENGVNALPGTAIVDNGDWALNGGGIYTNGFLTMRKSTVSGNVGVTWGALYAHGDVAITDSTIANNDTSLGPNVKLGPYATGDIIISSSTVSGNRVVSASQRGAALWLMHDTVITDSTITGNVEQSPSGNKYGAGVSLGSNVDVTFRNTIISGNGIMQSGQLEPSDIGIAHQHTNGSINAQSAYNLVGMPVSGLSFPDANGNQLVVTDPELGPLQDNGGPTYTHLPRPGSPVINLGNSSASHDQRGMPRISDGRADIGAVELTDMELHDRIFADGFQ